MNARPSAAEQRLFAWPDRENLRITSVLAIAFAVVWGVVYGGANLLTGLHSVRFRVHTAWELQLPFIPELAFLYLSLILMMLLPLLVYRTWQELIPLLVVLVVQTLIAGVFFLFLPVATVFPEPVAVGFVGGVFHIADALNLEHNYLPSLHVSYAFTTALAIGKRCGPIGKCLFLAWATGIAISSMLIRQHYLVDIVTGIALAWLAMAWLYDGARSPAVLRTIGTIERSIGKARRVIDKRTK